jgi:hypothetical protein
MSAIPAHALDDVNNIDSNYLQFVVGLLDDADHNNYGDFVGRERADSINEFLRRERADSITDFLKRDRQDSITDFLPKQSDFLMRDRAFSWDLNMEEQMHTEGSNAKGIAGVSGKTEPPSAVVDKKRKLDKVVPSKTQKSATTKSPPLPSKVGNKSSLLVNKAKVSSTKSAPVDQNNAKRFKSSLPDGKLLQKPSDHLNTDVSMINTKMVPGAVLGQIIPHALSANGPTLTRYDPISMHLIDQAGIMPALHPLDASCPRVGAYTKEERQVIIAKFRAKKMRRVWRKQIKYDCRKRLADTRPRVKGRFVSRKDRESQASASHNPLEGETELETTSGEGDFDDE